MTPAWLAAWLAAWCRLYGRLLQLPSILHGTRLSRLVSAADQALGMHAAAQLLYIPRATVASAAPFVHTASQAQQSMCH